MKTAYKLTILLLASVFIFSCGGNDNNGHAEKVNTEILQMMREVYLWYSDLPVNIDPGDYSDPATFMEALRYERYDRWSTAITEEEYNQYFEEGQMVGHGFMVGLDAEDNFRIAFVYPNTEAAEKGIRRGWILTKVNGTTIGNDNFGRIMGQNAPGVKNNMTFIDGDNNTVTIELTKELLELTPVIHSEIIQRGDDKIGYIVFQDFIEVANFEIDTTFERFVSSGITDLIVDMRYNGGGSADVALNLASWLLGKNFAGQPFINYEHNDKLNKPPYNLDTTYNVPSRANGLNLDRIFFIGTSNTASASELIINGVKPFVPSILAGTPTHGKPVGMYGIPIMDYVTLPICFKYTNKNHEGDFYNGINPALPAEDDITKDFGDPEEKSLKAILRYIDTGESSQKSLKSTEFNLTYMARKEPIGQFLRAF